MGCLKEFRVGIVKTFHTLRIYYLRPTIYKLTISLCKFLVIKIDYLPRENYIFKSEYLKPTVKLTSAIICSIDSQNYLKVNPDSPMWVTFGSDIIYQVLSNTNWEIH